MTVIEDKSGGWLAALCRTIEAIKPLDKDDKNQHQGYKYTSIDTYYHEIPKVAAANGLWWNITEVEQPVQIEVSVQKRGGEVAQSHAFLYRFRCSLYYGERPVVSNDYTILHPAQGPQTTGSAMSYAEKLFMRTTFKVPTGEFDADSVDQDLPITKPVAARAAPPSQPAWKKQQEPRQETQPQTAGTQDVEATDTAVYRDEILKAAKVSKDLEAFIRGKLDALGKKSKDLTHSEAKALVEEINNLNKKESL